MTRSLTSCSLDEGEEGSLKRQISSDQFCPPQKSTKRIVEVEQPILETDENSNINDVNNNNISFPSKNKIKISHSLSQIKLK